MAEKDSHGSIRIPAWVWKYGPIVVMALIAIAGSTAPYVTTWVNREANIDMAISTAKKAHALARQNESELNTLSGTIGQHKRSINQLRQRFDQTAGKIEKLLEGQAAIKATLRAMQQRMDRNNVDWRVDRDIYHNGLPSDGS